jgi:hypothetical protein
MQSRFKGYQRFISCCRALRDLVPPGDQSVPVQTSPALIFTATVLAFLLVVLEIDLHRFRLHSMGLVNEKEGAVELPLISP